MFIIYLLQSVFVLSAYTFRVYADWFILAVYAFLAGTTVAFFHVMSRYGVKVRRYDLIDRVIKGRLRFLKDENNLLGVSTTVLSFLLPGLVIMNSVLARGIPRYASAAALVLALALVLFWALGSRMIGGMVRTVLYFMIPAIIYFGQEHPMALSGYDLSLLYIGACVACLVSPGGPGQVQQAQGSFAAAHGLPQSWS